MTPDDIARLINEDMPPVQPVEVHHWVTRLHELDMGDFVYYLAEVRKPGMNFTFVDGPDIEKALETVMPAPTPDMLKSVGPLDDTDEFEEKWKPSQYKGGVVFYRGEGSLEDIAIAYVKAILKDGSIEDLK